jgi:hypothetical protein
MPRRKYSKTKTDVTKPSKRITLPIELERYQEIIDEPSAFRHWLDKMIERYPELFPATIEEGYTLHDMRSSCKIPDVRLRRIKLKGCDGRVDLSPSSTREEPNDQDFDLDRLPVETRGRRAAGAWHCGLFAEAFES